MKMIKNGKEVEIQLLEIRWQWNLVQLAKYKFRSIGKSPFPGEKARSGQHTL